MIGHEREVLRVEIGVSVLVAAVGAVLRWWVPSHGADGFGLQTVGVILLLAGLLGVVISFALWYLGGHRRAARPLGDAVVHKEPEDI
jgi:hypothetical protein